MFELVHILEHVRQVLQVGRAACEIEHSFVFLPDGHSAALGVDGREVVGEGVDAVYGALLKRVLLDFVVLAVFLLLYCELLDCRQVAMFLVLLVHLPLGGLPAFALLTITEHLLLEGC